MAIPTLFLCQDRNIKGGLIPLVILVCSVSCIVYSFTFCLFLFITIQLSISSTMDFNQRILTLQQVMSSFSHLCPKNSVITLKSAENYHNWDTGVRSILNTFGSGLLEFFTDGDLLVPPGTALDDPSVVQLTLYLNRALQVVLTTTVDAEVLSSYQCEGLSGSALLAAIRRDYSSLSARQLYKMVDTLVKASSMQTTQSLLFLKTIRAQFAHGMTIDHLLGLIYLKSFNDTTVESRVLDVSNPQLGLSAIEVALKDITTSSYSTSPSSQVLLTKKTINNRRNKPKELVCHRCQAKGHTSVNCTAPAPVPRSGDLSSSRSSAHDKTQDDISWSVNTRVSIDDTYTLDTGSSLHVSNNLDHFVDYTPSITTENVTGIADSKLDILGYGTVAFVLADKRRLLIRNVAYIPDAVRNLISIHLVTRNTGIKFVFEDYSCYLGDGTMVGRFMSGTLYQFVPKPIRSAHVSLSVQGNIMHSRLGHPSPEVMRALGFTPPDGIKICPDCSAGKMTRTFPKFSTTKTTAPLQLIHSDVCGPISVPGLGGEKYFLTIVDDFTRWCSIVALKAKSGTTEAIIDFITNAETHFASANHKVGALRSDNGTEYCNNQLKAYLRAKGISHQLTVPYNSSQNGVAERKHRTIQEKARSLLHESGLQLKFWTEAIKVAEFLANRYPSKVLDDVSPFYLWMGQKPNYSLFHAFGCQCVALIPPQKRNNIFSPVSVPGIFVGYSPTNKAYRVFVPHLDNVFISNNVQFDDTSFPMMDPLKRPRLVESGDLTPSDIFFGASAGGIPAVSGGSGGSSGVGSVSAVVDDFPDDVADPSFSPSPCPSRSTSSENFSPSSDENFKFAHSENRTEVVETADDAFFHSANHDDEEVAATTVQPEGDVASDNFSDPGADEDGEVAPSTTSTALVYPVYDEVHQVPIEPSLLPLRRVRSDVSVDSVIQPPLQKQCMVHMKPMPPLIPQQRSIEQVSEVDFSEAKRFKALFLSSNAVHSAFAASVISSAVPATYDQAVVSSDKSLWLAAIKVELDAHAENSTWSLVHLPAGRRAIGCRWVFTIKDSTNPPTYKARLVAQGFRQVYGLDYFETFSPVVRYESIRIVLALSAHFGLLIHQMDVSTAFLNGTLDEEIYMRIPDGIDAPHGLVCKLNKSLYGLKQAPLCWNKAINMVLLSAGFCRSTNEFGIYTKVTDKSIVVVALYVDDLLICSNNMVDIQSVKDLLSSHYKMKDLGVASRFLGMNLTQTKFHVELNLSHYLNEYLRDFNMQDCNPVSTPFAAGTDFLPGDSISDADVSRFRSMVGKLLFAANTCRPDLSFAASTLSRFIKDPKANHVAAAKHVLRYIKGTMNYGLSYNRCSNFRLVGYSDSDWAGDKFDRKSITGYVFMLSGCAITWKSKKQSTVALSSTEAEYMALGDTVKELLWLVQLVQNIGLKFKNPPTVFEDNEGCKLLSNHPVHHQRTKHIDIRHHFIREHLNNNLFILESASTDDMAADMFTKNLNRLKFKKFVHLIGMQDVLV